MMFCRYQPGKSHAGSSLFVLLVLLLGGRVDAAEPRQYAVEVSATVQASPAQIALSWPADPNATGYSVFRKAVSATSWGSPVALPGGATSYIDATVAVGTTYEYQIQKSAGYYYPGYGYIWAAINAPLVENRGKVVLIVDTTHAADLAFELERLNLDLTGDGWTVLRHNVSPSDTVPSVKALIKGDYDADPANVKSVFLFGHVPVPYSGNFGPDGHSGHQGAWPADAYYGDMDGNWTDATVNTTSADRPANRNVPGDGKFDQSDLPSDIELQVGRVDLSNMTCFSNKIPSRSELDLLRQYLNKDHNFRHGLLAVERRGLVCDNFGERNGEAFAASGFRNFAPFFGAANTTETPYGTYFSAVGSQSYLWSYGTGGGAFYTCNGIGSSDDFALNDPKTVFTMFFGSYFGDWDNESNFLRAPLGSSSYCLTVSWAGRPHWFLHHMALGETIGFSTRLSQNNSQGGLYSVQNFGTRQAHIALMGDPTLRMHPVVPPSNLAGVVTSTSVSLTWAASTDSDLQGYHVYRAASPAGPFTRITGSVPVSGTAFTDTVSGTHTYMVRAIKLERSGSGTYYNGSQGIFFPAQDGSSGTQGVPAAPASLALTVAGTNQLNLVWVDGASNEVGFDIERKTGAAGTYAQIATVGMNATSFSDAGLGEGTQYFYRVRSYNSAGVSAYCSEASATTSSGAPVAASATFVKTDTTTQGNWKGAYGAGGYTVMGNADMNPNYAQLGVTGNSLWTWADPTGDVAALEKSGTTSERIAACWYSFSTFTIDLNLTDNQTHRVSFYCLDWDASGRVQTIDVLDAASGAVLSSQTISNFTGGKFLVWDLRGHIQVRFTHVAGANVVLGGIFFDAAPATAPVTASNPILLRSTGAFQLRINGQPGQQFVVEASTNFTGWLPISTNTLSGTTFDFVDTNAAGFGQRFYRSRPLP